jgi:hypothetical protein
MRDLSPSSFELPQVLVDARLIDVVGGRYDIHDSVRVPLRDAIF